MSAPGRDEALAFDVADPLADFRHEFVVSKSAAIYADGNSLGPPLRVMAARVNALMAEWADDLTGGWERWVDLPLEVGDRLGAAALGAGAGQVAICDSTSVNLVKTIGAAIDAVGADRTELVVAAEEFPTDRYLIDSIANQRGLSVVRVASAAGLVDACGGATAVVVASVVNYRSGELLDVAAMTDAVHTTGAEIVWDLSHAVGAVPVHLDEWRVCLAVGCTYKYLNAGPGAPAFVYVAREHQARFTQPLWGWFGQHDQFAMGPTYAPADGMRSWLVGTPNILGTVLVDEGVSLLARAGIDGVRAKSERLVAYAHGLADVLLVPLGWSIVTPGDPARRGGHLSIARADAKSVCAELIARQMVIPDFRAPDVLRLGFSPLPTRFVDVYDAITAVATI